jgi:PIN domain nuclease of toxin-antitoxin system
MKRLAVLIHGQPRFINYTWKFIKEEYTVPDIETCYFAHMWEDVGYTPDNSIDNQYTKLNLSDNIKKDLTLLKIDNYDILYDVVRDFHPKIKEIILNKYIPVRSDNLDSLGYRYGQHVSRQQAYKLLKEYEKIHDIKFDIIAVVRPEFIYKNKQCYKTEKKYIQEKIDLYKDINSDSNLLKINTALYRKGTSYHTVVDSYHIERYKLVNFTYKTPFDRLFDRLCLGDRWVLCSRDIAHHYCDDWFDTCLRMLRELKALDIGISAEEKRKWGDRQIRGSEIMLGRILIRNKINLIKTKNRIKRLIDPDNCKQKFLVKNIWIKNVIHCKDGLDVDAQHQHIQNRLIELS